MLNRSRTGSRTSDLDGAMATGAAALWTPLVRNFVDSMQPSLREGASVLEIGYGNGKLACYLAERFRCKITGYDIDRKAYQEAQHNVAACEVESKIDLHLISPDETMRLTGSYDAVVIKTVLYNAKDLGEYGRWLDWVGSVLKPNGHFLNFENGRGNRGVYLYRKLRRRYYIDRCMFDGRIEQLYRDRFEIEKIKYAAGLAWVFGKSRLLYPIASYLEDLLYPRTADNSFVAALLCRKR